MARAEGRQESSRDAVDFRCCSIMIFSHCAQAVAIAIIIMFFSPSPIPCPDVPQTPGISFLEQSPLPVSQSPRNNIHLLCACRSFFRRRSIESNHKHSAPPSFQLRSPSSSTSSLFPFVLFFPSAAIFPSLDEGYILHGALGVSGLVSYLLQL